jgi:hypothetical protein
MQGAYTVGPLSASGTGRAFAVINHVFPAASLEEWQAATASEQKRRNWLAVTDAAGVIRGLAHVFVSHQPDWRQLEVPVFVSVSLFEQRRVAGVLFRLAGQRATLEHCSRIHIWPERQDHWALLTSSERPLAPDDGLLFDMRSDGHLDDPVWKARLPLHRH